MPDQALAPDFVLHYIHTASLSCNSPLQYAHTAERQRSMINTNVVSR